MTANLPVKVAVIITGLGVGGAELRQLTVAKSIDKTKVCLDFYCLYDENNRLIPEFENIGCKVCVVKVFDYTKHFLRRINYFSIFKLSRMLRKGRYDIVHTQLPHANTIGRIAAELAGIKKHIATICNMEKSSGWQLFWDKLLGMRSCKIMCISESVRDLDRQHTLLDFNKYIVIYNGIDPAKFSRTSASCPLKLSDLGSNSDYFVVCSVGRLHPIKDFSNLLQAFAIVAEKYGNSLLMIVGAGDEMEKLKSLAIGLGLIDKVLFLGTRTDIPDILSCADLFVSSSLSEGFGNTIIEALSMQLPVVATNIPPYKEIIGNNIYGILVPAKNPQKMAKAICDMLSDNVLRQNFAAKGREVVLSRFSHNVMIDRLERLYLSCMNGGSFGA